MEFDRIVSLIGKDKFNKIQTQKVLIVGIGGVGGYALESLVRSGITNVDLIDYDLIDITNINRQIIATKKNINNNKVDEALKRIKIINENINSTIYNEFLDDKNIEKILSNNYDYIVDACDSINTKLNLIKYKNIYNYKLISSMGTAKKLDPTKLEITELSKTEYDPLAKKLRKLVKDNNIKDKVIVVSSKEIPLDCDELGSFMFVPATAGILCTKYIIEDIINS